METEIYKSLTIKKGRSDYEFFAEGCNDGNGLANAYFARGKWRISGWAGGIPKGTKELRLRAVAMVDIADFIDELNNENA